MNDLLEIVARSGGSATLPSLGNILFVTETGSTTQSRADGLGRIDKPFELQRAFDEAQPDDIIIVYGASPVFYSVNKNRLRIFIYSGSIEINFNNTSSQEIYCYTRGGTTVTIRNITFGKVNTYTSQITIELYDCNSLAVSCEQRCIIRVFSDLSNCTFKSNIRSTFIINISATFSNLNIENFDILNNSSATITFTNCTLNKSIFYPLLSNSSNINNCFFYDSRININHSSTSFTLNFQNNKFVRCPINFSGLSSIQGINGIGTTNKFIDCILLRGNNNSVRIRNTTWILKDCTIYNPNILNNPSFPGFFRVDNCNLYFIDCKYEVPPSSPYAISNDYTGELQLINCQLNAPITGGKTPTVTNNLFIGTLPNLNDVLDNI